MEKIQLQPLPQLSIRAKGRTVVSEEEGIVLEEAQAPYNRLFEGEKSTIRLDNNYTWDSNKSNSGR